MISSKRNLWRKMRSSRASSNSSRRKITRKSWGNLTKMRIKRTTAIWMSRECSISERSGSTVEMTDPVDGKRRSCSWLPRLKRYSSIPMLSSVTRKISISPYDLFTISLIISNWRHPELTFKNEGKARIYDKIASNFKVAEEVGIFLGLAFILAFTNHCSSVYQQVIIHICLILLYP